MVGNVAVGGGAPIVVQSMTNTDTADIDGTVAQVAALARAGSELVRITVDRDEAAAAVPHIRDGLRKRGITTPLIGDFHYIGHKLLADYPACAEALDKYRINPGNVGFKNKRDTQFADIIEIAQQEQQAGPHRRQLGFARPGTAHQTDGRKRAARRTERCPRGDARGHGAVGAAVGGARPRTRHAQEQDDPVGESVRRAGSDRGLQDLARRSDYAIHLGLTEAGMGSKGIVASSAALGILLQQGIGDTMRISLTPEPGGDRTLEVQVAQELLQTMGFRTFVPLVAACPGCGRTTSTTFQELARRSRTSSATRCRAGRRAIPASRGSTSRSWAASSTAPANPSMPISASRCPAPAKPRRRRCSSTARSSRPCAAPTCGEFKAMVIDYIDQRYGAGAAVPASTVSAAE